MQFGEAGGRGVAAALVAVLIAFACALAVPAVAAAETFEVNSAADGEDAAPGDEFCKTAAEECTLRAALEESNALGGEDTIGFARATFDGGPGATISLGSTLPTIEGVVSIVGECVLAGSFVRPCVGVDGPGNSEPALIIKNTEFVTVIGLAITGAETGIEVIGTRKFKALSDWLGVKLDGSAGGNGTGILVGAGSTDGQLGNEGETNVFAHNTADGLDIHGAGSVRVMGGYFGVGPDGATSAPNGGKDIEVAAFDGFEASGNTIGTQVGSQEAASPRCDGGCNVVSGAGAAGIDLEGDGGEEAPAADTTVIGNYIGLDASGTVAVPNVDGIWVGQAVGASIGGPRAAEANRLVGGDTAVSAGPGAAGLVVHGNLIGVGADGGSLIAPDAGIAVNSEGLPGPGADATIAGNQIRMDGGVAIAQQGLGGWLVGNWITGADIGIKTSGEAEKGHGNLIQGNTIEASAINGILIESGLNEIFANAVLGSAGAGIRIAGAGFSAEFGVSGNLVGGDVEADENAIAAGGGAAIEISNPEKAANEVARNWGFANDGLFIDLDYVAFPGDKGLGTNEGIKPPVFAAAGQSEAAGFGALPDATIRLFRKASAEAGELESFLGEAIADEEGDWAVAYDTPIPGGTIVAATQTSAVGGTSELAVATTTAEPGDGGEEEGGGDTCGFPGGCAAGPGPSPTPVLSPSSAPSPPPPPPAPETKIFTGPKGKKFARGTVAFKFKADVAGAGFQCRLDRGPFAKCHSPRVYTSLKPGKHRFEVRAMSAGGIDATPAKLKFAVLG